MDGTLTKCLECNRLFSPTLSACPHCKWEVMNCPLCRQRIAKSDQIEGYVYDRRESFHRSCLLKNFPFPLGRCPDCHVDLSIVGYGSAITVVEASELACKSCGYRLPFGQWATCDLCQLPVHASHLFRNKKGSKFHTWCIKHHPNAERHRDDSVFENLVIGVVSVLPYLIGVAILAGLVWVVSYCWRYL